MKYFSYVSYTVSEYKSSKENEIIKSNKDFPYRSFDGLLRLILLISEKKIQKNMFHDLSRII